MIGDPERVVAQLLRILNLFDALLEQAAPLLGELPEGPCVDVGSGAGLPDWTTMPSYPSFFPGASDSSDPGARSREGPQPNRAHCGWLGPQEPGSAAGSPSKLPARSAESAASITRR